MEGDVITLQDIFSARAPEGAAAGGPLVAPLAPTSLRPGFLSKLKANGVDLATAAWLGAA
jgi:hypothetical protein